MSVTSDNNFALVAIINALSFLASSLIVLLHKRRQLTHEAVVATSEKPSLLSNLKCFIKYGVDFSRI